MKRGYFYCHSYRGAQETIVLTLFLPDGSQPANGRPVKEGLVENTNITSLRAPYEEGATLCAEARPDSYRDRGEGVSNLF
jgi:hypothetical protein